jgi:hypothetical protein
VCIIAVVERLEKPDGTETHIYTRQDVKTPKGKMCVHMIDLLQLETLTK